MPDYRLYKVEPSGKIAGQPIEFFAVSDEAAIDFAATQECPVGCELWERERLVARLDQPKGS